MKKFITLVLIIMLIIISSVNVTSSFNYKNLNENKNFNQKNSTFTNTVFIEETTATWCPNCPAAADTLYNIYQSNNYSFYYVALVHDMNTIAKKRNLDYNINIRKIVALPTVYLDGGYINLVGEEINVEQTKSAIEQTEQRTTRKQITMKSTVTWNDHAKLTVSLTITNQGNSIYLGKIRSYVTEIKSRWTDYAGNQYHFGFLDFALNKVILLMPGESKNLTGRFNGASNHRGQTYSDITSDNIMVISTISNFVPHYSIGYKSETYTQRYFSYYVDQTTAATPT